MPGRIILQRLWKESLILPENNLVFYLTRGKDIVMIKNRTHSVFLIKLKKEVHYAESLFIDC